MEQNTVIASRTATEIVQQIRDGQTTAEEVSRNALARISRVEKNIRAWEFLDEDLILAQARALDRSRDKGEALGALHGVPIGVKDVFNTADMPTAMGSSIWQGFTPGNDSRVVAATREAGGVIFGKTVTAEFAVHYLAEEKTVNPHNPSHTPGTSSSGSAAAVSSGMVPVAFGTQTAGSIIRPASFCGVFGFKPTFGTLPRTGVLKTSDTLDSIGYLASSIGDLRLMFETTHVKGRDYPFVHEYLKAWKGDLKDIRIGIFDSGIGLFSQYERYTLERFDELVEDLRRTLPGSIAKVTFPPAIEEIHDLHATIYDKSLAYYFKQEARSTHKISPVMAEIMERAAGIPIPEYQRALDKQVELRKLMRSAFQPFDLVLTPSTAGEAPLIGVKEKPDTCLIWSFLGLPALSMPAFVSPSGMPFGLQLVAERYDDFKLLGAGDALWSLIERKRGPWLPAPC